MPRSCLNEPAARSPKSAGTCRALRRLLGLPEDGVDLGYQVQQLLAVRRIHRALAAAGAGLLGGLVEQLVQLRVLLEVRRLEVVGPQHPQVVLDEFRALLL